MPKLKEIIRIIEDFAPTSLKEPWDNPGLQVGNPNADITAILLCLDVTETILAEAEARGCNLIVTHHPLLFHGLKSVTGANATQRIVIEAIKKDIAIYSAHTNLDSTVEGVNYEIAHMLAMTDLKVLDAKPDSPATGLGMVGNIKPMPSLEFLRMTKETFHVKSLRFSSNAPSLVIRRVAVCGGAGASLIERAIAEKADAFVSGDLKYHDFTSYGDTILLADIGHFESELCTEKIFLRLLKERLPETDIFISETETNPIQTI